MAAVLAQMRGDAVGTGLDRGQRRAHRIGTLARPRIAQGGDVIDIYSETQRRGFGHSELLLTSPRRGEVEAGAQRRLRVRGVSVHEDSRRGPPPPAPPTIHRGPPPPGGGGG